MFNSSIIKGNVNYHQTWKSNNYSWALCWQTSLINNMVYPALEETGFSKSRGFLLSFFLCTVCLFRWMIRPSNKWSTLSYGWETYVFFIFFFGLLHGGYNTVRCTKMGSDTQWSELWFQLPSSHRTWKMLFYNYFKILLMSLKRFVD